jgi:hypothetical protein
MNPNGTADANSMGIQVIDGYLAVSAYQDDSVTVLFPGAA